MKSNVWLFNGKIKFGLAPTIKFCGMVYVSLKTIENVIFTEFICNVNLEIMYWYVPQYNRFMYFNLLRFSDKQENKYY